MRAAIRRRRLLAGALSSVPGLARAQIQPITIGFGEALTCELVLIARSGLLATRIWADQINANGGLLGRPVKLIYYDNESNPAKVPGIYARLLNQDRVDLVLSGYATNVTAPAMPIVMERNKLFISLFCLAVNSEFHYPRYLSILPCGPDPKHMFSEGFFRIAQDQPARPETVAILAADAEYARSASEGAADNARNAGFKILLEEIFPSATTDYNAVVRMAKAVDADMVYVASYPDDTAGILRAAHDVGLRPRLFGGNMIGVSGATLKQKLGPLMNGIVVSEPWVPAPTLRFPGVHDFLKQYQAKAGAEEVDPLGYFLPPWAFARMQVLQQAVEGAKSIDDAALADYAHSHTFRTVVGDVAFNPDGEWSEPRLFWTQFQGITGHDLEQFRGSATEVVIFPARFQSGSLIYPYWKAAR